MSRSPGREHHAVCPSRECDRGAARPRVQRGQPGALAPAPSRAAQRLAAADSATAGGPSRWAITAPINCASRSTGGFAMAAVGFGLGLRLGFDSPGAGERLLRACSDFTGAFALTGLADFFRTAAAVAGATTPAAATVAAPASSAGGMAAGVDDAVRKACAVCVTSGGGSGAAAVGSAALDAVASGSAGADAGAGAARAVGPMGEVTAGCGETFSYRCQPAAASASASSRTEMDSQRPSIRNHWRVCAFDVGRPSSRRCVGAAGRPSFGKRLGRCGVEGVVSGGFKRCLGMDVESGQGSWSVPEYRIARSLSVTIPGGSGA